MWYKIPNYTMKCRIYPNKTQHEIIDKILYGIRVAYNVTMYEMITNFKNTKEAKDKKEDKIVHFPQLRNLERLIKIIPKSRLANVMRKLCCL